MRTPFVIGIIVVVTAAVLAALAFSGNGSETATPEPSTTTTTVLATTGPPPTGAETPPTTVGGPGPPGDVGLATAAWPTDWSMASIELDELKLGLQAIDPRDLIRPLDEPDYVSVADADEWLVDREIGVLLEIDDVARFYPLRIITSHEIVNDQIGEVPYSLTYCPLCNTSVAFDRRVDGEVLRFGVSGLLRNSDLVMWDDKTVSLWQQIVGEAIVGSFVGTRLEVIPTATVRWADFRANHPDGEVLSRDTGSGFAYESNSYIGYTGREAPIPQFFDAELDERFPALSRVVGVREGGESKAYPFVVLEDDRTVNDELGGVPVTVWWAPTDSADNFDGAAVGGGAAIGTGIAYVRTVDGQTLTFEAAEGTTFTDLETGSTWTLFGDAIAGPLEGSSLELAEHQNEFWFAWSTFNPGAPVHGG